MARAGACGKMPLGLETWPTLAVNWSGLPHFNARKPICGTWPRQWLKIVELADVKSQVDDESELSISYLPCCEVRSSGSLLDRTRSQLVRTTWSRWCYFYCSRSASTRFVSRGGCRPTCTAVPNLSLPSFPIGRVAVADRRFDFAGGAEWCTCRDRRRVKNVAIRENKLAVLSEY